MMKKSRILTCALICAALTATLSGCSTVKKYATTNSTPDDTLSAGCDELDGRSCDAQADTYADPDAYAHSDAYADPDTDAHARTG